MLNQAPIVINVFTRAGTKILMNLLLSQPGVYLPTGETHEVFKGRALGVWRRASSRSDYVAICQFV